MIRQELHHQEGKNKADQEKLRAIEAKLVSLAVKKKWQEKIQQETRKTWETLQQEQARLQKEREYLEKKSVKKKRISAYKSMKKRTKEKRIQC